MKSFKEFLTEKTVADTDTPKFKQWFDASKVVDSNGNPLVVYHGTKGSFTHFNTPAWFSDKQDMADKFSAEWGTDQTLDSKSKVIAVYLSIQNPFLTDDWEVTEKKAYNPEWVSSMKLKGYDGVIFQTEDETEYIVFDPEQIKSIYNNGNFCIDNPVINE